MPPGPTLIFDKSSLESLNLDEAVLLDHFYMCNITPLFYIECLADLEKLTRSKSTPEQLVGSLADRTPDAQAYPNVHHLSILDRELSRRFDITKVYGDRKSTRLNSSHASISYAVFCLKRNKGRPTGILAPISPHLRAPAAAGPPPL